MKRAMIILGDDHCKDYYYDDDECEKCEDGYYLEKGNCLKNLCVEGQNEDSCEMCLVAEGRCISCYSDDYSVYERYICKKAFIVCGNNTINNCEKCEIVNNTETGSCEQCYNKYYPVEQSCVYNNIEIIKMNKFLNYFIVLFLLLIN